MQLTVRGRFFFCWVYITCLEQFNTYSYCFTFSQYSFRLVCLYSCRDYQVSGGKRESLQWAAPTDTGQRWTCLRWQCSGYTEWMSLGPSSAGSITSTNTLATEDKLFFSEGFTPGSITHTHTHSIWAENHRTSTIPNGDRPILPECSFLQVLIHIMKSFIVWWIRKLD